MYARNSFEQSPLGSTFRRPSPNKLLPSPLFSHTCALLRPHPISFAIHPQNTPGVGLPSVSSQSLFTSAKDPLSLLFPFFVRHPLPPLLPRRPLSPFPATLTHHPCGKSFRCNSYAKTPGGGLTNLQTVSFQNGTNLRTSPTLACPEPRRVAFRQPRGHAASPLHSALTKNTGEGGALISLRTTQSKNEKHHYDNSTLACPEPRRVAASSPITSHRSRITRRVDRRR